MPRWNQGEATIERLLTAGHLQPITGAAADGHPWLDKARKTLATAEKIVDTDPDSACVLAYDAARHACMALLVQQGLRATTAGGHYAVEEAVRAQFGTGLKRFGMLRRRRNELEYPTYPGDIARAGEAAAAVTDAEQVITAAGKLLENLDFFYR